MGNEATPRAISRRAALAGGVATLLVTGAAVPKGRSADRVPPKWDVFVTSPLTINTTDRLPDGQAPTFPPISSTLIYGERDAVLVDGFLTVAQAQRLADWVKASGKNLTTIYATHAHADHFFGAGTVLEHFPRARFVAMPNVVEKMRAATAPQAVGSAWKQRFPDQIPDHFVIAGHKRPGSNDDSRIIEETRQYIRDFDRTVETAASAADLYDRMMALYPDRLNANALWVAARAAKG
jgi:hypothetical protein